MQFISKSFCMCIGRESWSVLRDSQWKNYFLKRKWKWQWWSYKVIQMHHETIFFSFVIMAFYFKVEDLRSNDSQKFSQFFLICYENSLQNSRPFPSNIATKISFETLLCNKKKNSLASVRCLIFLKRNISTHPCFNTLSNYLTL